MSGVNEVPYRASWMNRLFEWITKLPIPVWLTYLIALAGLIVLVTVSRWIEGTLAVGAVDAEYAYGLAYPVGLLAAIHYLKATAATVFDAFLPALGKSETEAASLKYELAIVPARGASFAGAIGAAYFIFVFSPQFFRELIDVGRLAISVLAVTSLIGFVFFAVLIYYAIRQLRLVGRIHSLAKNVDLLNYSPLYAFSRLTVRTGLIFIFLVYFNLVFNPLTFKFAGLIWTSFLVVPIAAACFILPLEGMHRRIIAEKLRLEREVNQRLDWGARLLYARADTADLRDADAINKTIASLIAMRDLIAKIPTWPWQPQTLAALLSALLPIFIFLAQQYLRTILGIN